MLHGVNHGKASTFGETNPQPPFPSPYLNSQVRDFRLAVLGMHQIAIFDIYLI
ncbi:hypothetical protein D3C78_926040 [compost metagenome]